MFYIKCALKRAMSLRYDEKEKNYWLSGASIQVVSNGAWQTRDCARVEREILGAGALVSLAACEAKG